MSTYARARALLGEITQDWAGNRHDPKMRVLLCFFRFTSILRRNAKGPLAPIHFVTFVAYRLFSEWLLGIEIPAGTPIGPGLRIFHGYSLVINRHTVIGSNVILRHSVTIGHRHRGVPMKGRSPIIGDNVEVGSNAVILGPIHIGDGATVAAGAVVLHDVPAGAVVAGNPAKVVRDARATA